jgi:hypothetical protein
MFTPTNDANSKTGQRAPGLTSHALRLHGSRKIALLATGGLKPRYVTHATAHAKQQT